MSDEAMAETEPMISVRNVSKTFKVKKTEGGGGPFGGGGTSKAIELTALRNISFDVARGHTVGIVGHNGAGKSTLLKVVAGILRPDSGSVEVNGEITPILGLQAGFAPDLTGLENLYLKGAALGMTDAEVDALVEQISDYARIGEAMYQPLRTYSSGMRMRLAFAITFLDTPEVLIVDETVAVGDSVFRRKSMARIEEIKSQGATILLVSHGTHLLRGFCDRVLVLDGGELLLDAPAGPAVDAYEYLMCAAPEERDAAREHLREWAGAPERSIRTHTNGDEVGPESSTIEIGLQPETYHRSQGALATGARFRSATDKEIRQARPGADARVECNVMFIEPARNVTVEMTLASVSGREAASLTLEPVEGDASYIAGGEEVVFTAPVPELATGDYLASVDVFGFVGPDHHHLHGVGSLAALRIAEPSEQRLQQGPLFFLHVPRTAGTSVRTALERGLGDRLVPVYANGSDDPLAAVRERGLRPDGVLFGELQFGVHELLGESPRYATVLRHPVDRVLSWYRAQASDPERPHHELVVRTPLVEILERQMVPEVCNYVTSLLAGRAIRGHLDEEAYQLAVEHLAHFEFMALAETLPYDMLRLESIVGAKLPELERSSFGDGAPGGAGEAAHALIRYNLLDLRLYEIVRTVQNHFLEDAGA